MTPSAEPNAAGRDRHAVSDHRRHGSTHALARGRSVPVTVDRSVRGTVTYEARPPEGTSSCQSLFSAVDRSSGAAIVDDAPATGFDAASVQPPPDRRRSSSRPSSAAHRRPGHGRLPRTRRRRVGRSHRRQRRAATPCQPGLDALGDRVGGTCSSPAAPCTPATSPATARTPDGGHPYATPRSSTEDTYGPLKVACEDDVITRFGRARSCGRARWPAATTLIRASTYWVRRAARGGTGCIARRPRPAQSSSIDSRALARLVVQLITDGRSGAFHAVGPSTTMAELIHTCADVAGASSRRSRAGTGFVSADPAARHVARAAPQPGPSPRGRPARRSARGHRRRRARLGSRPGRAAASVTGSHRTRRHGSSLPPAARRPRPGGRRRTRSPAGKPPRRRRRWSRRAP